jgi:hypothetical protein
VQELVEIRRRYGEVAAPPTVDAVRSLCHLQERLGMLGDAVALCREQWGHEKRVLGDADPVTLDTQRQLGMLFEKAGRGDLAEVRRAYIQIPNTPNLGRGDLAEVRRAYIQIPNTPNLGRGDLAEVRRAYI